MPDSDLSSIGQEILLQARNELMMALPYMGEALCALRFLPGEETTPTAACDGEALYYNAAFLADRFLRSGVLVTRLYLHTVLHCMLRHLAKKRGRESELWDLACDAAVESILDGFSYPCLARTPVPARLKFYGECRAEMKVLTAEGIYRYLLRARLSPFELAQLQRAFLEDDHGLWDPEQQDSEESSEQQDRKWQNIASRAQTGMETVLSQEAHGGEAVLEQIRVAARDDVDYRAFLRRFAAPREVLRCDEDAFDYVYYTYGLSHYGNMPLIEPPESKEEKRIEDLVIAIDTSMSTSGELVRAFLSCTYSVLRSVETFTSRLNIHIMQCDDELRSDTQIRSMAELQEYMDHIPLTGGSATDFRPVFDRIEALQKEGAFSSLRGLIYFTDGMGVYPSRRPPYETAFVLLEEPPLSYRMPPWCIRLVLDFPDLERAQHSSGIPDDTDDDILDTLSELPDL